MDMFSSITAAHGPQSLAALPPLGPRMPTFLLLVNRHLRPSATSSSFANKMHHFKYRVQESEELVPGSPWRSQRLPTSPFQKCLGLPLKENYYQDCVGIPKLRALDKSV